MKIEHEISTEGDPAVVRHADVIRRFVGRRPRCNEHVICVGYDVDGRDLVADITTVVESRGGFGRRCVESHIIGTDMSVLVSLHA